MTNSNSSPHSSLLELATVSLFLIVVASLAGWFFYSSGYILYYGDAQAHLNISRSIFDSRNPGYAQLGTVWLPILHVICLPFVGNNSLWSSGLAGTIPVALCFIVSGVCLYLCGKETYGTSVAASVVLLGFALNPNVLYLAATPMTELVFVAGLSVSLLSVLRFRKTHNPVSMAPAVFASWWMSLTRYDGWFLIPFLALCFAIFAPAAKLRMFVISASLFALAPIYWMAHNWFLTGNALDFFDGPYSAAAIQGNRPYPGFHDWPAALHYYFEAGRACCGNALMIAGIVGFVISIWQRRWLAVAFLSLTPLFYVWSVHSSKTPIHLPWLWPFGYYNSRYGLAVVVLMAFAMGAIVTTLPERRRWLGLLIPLFTVAPWLVKPSPSDWICWKESQVNSDARRAWTTHAVSFVNSNYHMGQGILTEFGDLAGIFCKAKLPLEEAIHEGDGIAWFVNTMPNGLLRQTRWAMAQEGGKLASTIAGAHSYRIVDRIQVPGAPDLLIYQRRYFGDSR